MSIKPEVTKAIIEDELPSVQAYVCRRGWQLEWLPDDLLLIFTGVHTKSETAVRITANVNGFREIPPAWTFDDPSDGDKKPFPKGNSPVEGKGSIFHSHKVICAPFNRLAYKKHNGPHSNWGDPQNWLQVREAGHVWAEKIADMFAIIFGHLVASERIQ